MGIIIGRDHMETRAGCRYKLLDDARLACAVFVVIIHLGYGDSFAAIPWPVWDLKNVF